MKALNVIGTAYRGTLEEQDDTIVWLTHAMKGAGADLDVLLRASAVNYASKAQEVAPLSFGDRVQKNAPHIAEDVSGLIGKGIAVPHARHDSVKGLVCAFAHSEAGIEFQGLPCKALCMASFKAAAGKTGDDVRMELEKTLPQDNACEFAFFCT